MTDMSIQPLWLTYFIEILLVLEFQLTKTYFGTFSYKAHFRPQISSNASKNSCACEGEQVFEQEIDEDKYEIDGDEEELQHDLRSENYAYESPIERWFQASMRLEQFIFYFLVIS